MAVAAADGVKVALTGWLAALVVVQEVIAALAQEAQEIHLTQAHHKEILVVDTLPQIMLVQTEVVEAAALVQLVEAQLMD